MSHCFSHRRAFHIFRFSILSTTVFCRRPFFYSRCNHGQKHNWFSVFLVDFPIFFRHQTTDKNCGHKAPGPHFTHDTNNSRSIQRKELRKTGMPNIVKRVRAFLVVPVAERVETGSRVCIGRTRWISFYVHRTLGCVWFLFGPLLGAGCWLFGIEWSERRWGGDAEKKYFLRPFTAHVALFSHSSSSTTSCATDNNIQHKTIPDDIYCFSLFLSPSLGRRKKNRK